MKAIFTRLILAVILTASGFGATGAPFAAQTFQGVSSPQSLSSLAAWYDASDVSSMRNNAGAIPASGDSIKLIGDKSGNSAVNCLVLNGAAGNYASAPSTAALQITADIGLFARIASNDYTPGTELVVGSKWVSTGNQRSYALAIATTGAIKLYWSADGTAVLSATSTAVLPLTDLVGGWVYATMDVNDGSGNRVIKFYYATDTGSNTEPTWTQLGTTVTTAGTTSIFASTAVAQVGCSDAGTSGLWGGLVHRFVIRNGYDGAGTIVFDPVFSTFAKLAASGTAITGQTVTINTSGATGARISGARDLYQGTAANQPILTIAAGGNYLTFDGSNDYLKAGAFSLPQPVTRLTAASQVSWTSGDYLWDGASAANSGAIIQTTTTPQINMNAGSSVAANTGFTLQTLSTVAERINGASSSLGINYNTLTTGNAGAANPNGVTIGASGASTAANFGNITFSERVEYSADLSVASTLSVNSYLWRKWSIPVSQ